MTCLDGPYVRLLSNNVNATFVLHKNHIPLYLSICVQLINLLAASIRYDVVHRRVVGLALKASE